MLLYVPVQIILLDQCQATHLVPAELGIVAQALDVVRTYAQVRCRILARHPHLRYRLRLTYGQYRVFHICINLTPSQYLIAPRLDITFSWLYIQLG